MTEVFLKFSEVDQIFQSPDLEVQADGRLSTFTCSLCNVLQIIGFSRTNLTSG